MDQIFCMRMFARVVELGSFVRASEALDVARPTATHCVAQLERQLGVRLLHRTTRRLSATEEGRAYYESCVRILDDIAEAQEAISKGAKVPRGRLRVSVPHAFTRLIFFPELPRFLAKYPELELEVVVSDTALDLIESGVDCAIRGVAIPDDSMLVARHISNVRWMTCASPAYIRKHGIPKRVDDLARHECVRFVSPSTNRAAPWRFEKNGTRETFTPKGRVAVTSLEAAAAVAVGGVGIAQVPEPLALPALRERTLKPVLLDRIAPAPPLNVVYPSNRYLTAKVRAFADFVAEIFPAERWR
jgi:LysR family transcriptional regulator, regulator for bpeEF and oprC